MHKNYKQTGRYALCPLDLAIVSACCLHFRPFGPQLLLLRSLQACVLFPSNHSLKSDVACTVACVDDAPILNNEDVGVYLPQQWHKMEQ